MTAMAYQFAMAVITSPRAPVRSTTRAIQSGDGGIYQTLDAMAQLIDNATADPLTVQFARQLAAGATPYKSQSQTRIAARIYSWLWSSFRFVDDPANRELLRAPDAMLREYDASGYVRGDCDEAAVLGAALAYSVGISPLLNIIEFDEPDAGGFSHVYASLLPDDGPEVSLDVTRPPKGTPVPPVKRISAMAV